MDYRYNPKQLTVITTNQCTARCAHCTMCSEPHRQGTLTYPQIKDAIEHLHSINQLLVVIFSGGEPTLLGDDLLDSIAYADSLGILTRLVTNAHWAGSRERARATLRELREAGLAEINISTDDYHLPFIPFKNVENAWKECKGIGFSAVVVANSHGPQSKINPEFIMDRLGETIHTRYDENGTGQAYCSPAEDGTLYLLSNACLQRVGRAKDNSINDNLTYPKNQERLNVGCRSALVNPALSPYNHLWVCCGIECENNDILDLGDMSAGNIHSLLFRANDNIVLNALILLGPLFIRNFIQNKCKDVGFLNSYTTVCQICEDVVKNPRAKEILRENYSELVQYIVAYEESQSE